MICQLFLLEPAPALNHSLGFSFYGKYAVIISTERRLLGLPSLVFYVNKEPIYLKL
jgi:hypothetical protein